MTVEQIRDEYDDLRGKWKDMITGGGQYDPFDPVIAAQIKEITDTATANWNRMENEPSTFLWTDVTHSYLSRTITLSYRRLKAMALAYATKGSPLEKNCSLLHAIKIGLSWLYQNAYNERIAIYDNEWDFKMGAPLEYNDIMVLLYDELVSTLNWGEYCAAVGHYANDTSYHGVSTGANRTWRSAVVAVFGINTKNAEKLIFAKKELEDPSGKLFEYVTEEDGFYTDGSFIQHYRFPYTGGYGIGLLTDLVNVMYLLAGTSWEVRGTADVNCLLYRWLSEAYEPLLYKGAMMDMTRGREISRSTREDHVSGHSIIQAIIRLAEFAPTSPINISFGLKQKVKYWILADTYRNFFTFAPIDMILLGRAILQDEAIPARDELILHKQFPNMDRVVHLRQGFGFAVSMCSSRIYNYESGNSENLKGWYTSDGMTYLYNTDLEQYSEGFWPTVDAYRLPGTTVDTQRRNAVFVDWNKEYLNPHNWVGGCSLSESVGICGMKLKASGNRDANGEVVQASSLRVKKSWFMFDDVIVCLGSGITASDDRTIETIIDNRKLSGMGDNALTVNGEAKSTVLGWSERMTQVQWIHQAGNASGAEIGYYFPRGQATINGLREARTSNWREINETSGSQTPLTRNYLTLWIDHGNNPNDETYAYVILPNQSTEQVSSFASNPNVTILENSTAAHAVKENELQLIGVNFWQNELTCIQDGGKNVIASHKKSSVLLRQTEYEIEIGLSDPTQANEGMIEIEIFVQAQSIISVDPRLIVNQLAPTIKLSADVRGANGRTIEAKFRLVE